MTFLSHVSPSVTSKGRHCSRIVKAHVSLRLPFESFNIELVVITCQVVKIDVYKTRTCGGWLGLRWLYLLDSCDWPSLLFSIYNI